MSKARGGDGIPSRLFQILKEEVAKLLYSIYQQIWKTQQWLQNWKIPIPKKGNAKEYSDYCIIVLISHASQVMLQSLKLGFKSM